MIYLQHIGALVDPPFDRVLVREGAWQLALDLGLVHPAQLWPLLVERRLRHLNGADQLADRGRDAYLEKSQRVC